MWACTTCFACVQECPVLIQHVESIVDVRRHLVLMEGAPPDLLGTAFTNAERSGNPWNDRSSRLDWTKPLDFDVPVMAEKKKVDVLYWIGCAGAFDPNSQKTSRAVAKILNAAGIEWAILGDEEQCHCEWARRGGNEFLYQESSLPIIETLNGYEFDVIITHCPHCFNTMKNEFPDFGGEYTVVHHSQYIAKLIAEGKIKPDYGNGRSNEMGAAVRHITYHDSCYLGRYNDVYESPRDLLKTIPGVQMVEMARSKDRGLCCGGGGAQVWMETHQHDPVNQIRLTEAVNALNGDVPYDVADAVRNVPETPPKVDKPGTVATACPFCTIMLDSAQQSMQIEDVQIRDVAEIVAEGIK
jgi:Fe-S oxidoreductase